MNTFLPYPSFDRSAESLDWKRLQKQIVEGIQLCNLICRLEGKPVPPQYENRGTGWKNHPVLKLWCSPAGNFYLRELISYIDCCAEAWSQNEHCKKRHLWHKIRHHYLSKDPRQPIILKWSDKFHETMRANLSRKDPDFYGKFNTKPQNGYIWEHPVEQL